MNAKQKIAILNLLVGVALFGIATSRVSILGIDYSTKLIVLLYTVIGVAFVLRYFLKRGRKNVDATKMILVAFWAAFNCLLLLKFEGLRFHICVLILIGLIWLVQEFIYQLIHFKKVQEFNWLRIAGVVILIIEFIFKVQRWPFLGPVLILALVGYSMTGISFIREFSRAYPRKGT